MTDEQAGKEQHGTEIIKVEEMPLSDMQTAEQLYHNAGLDPVVDAGLRDYDGRIQQENKLLNRVLGPRGSDIRGYGEAVAKRVAVAVYAQLNRQYGGKVGDLRSYMMTLEEERSRANTRYDDLMGRVIGILGDEYKELRTSSNEFLEKLTNVMGEDVKESRINQETLVQRLADIDGLRGQITAVEKEKEQVREKLEAQITGLVNERKEEKAVLTSRIDSLEDEKVELGKTHDSQLAAMKGEHDEAARKLEARISELETRTGELEAEGKGLSDELAKLRKDQEELTAAVTTLAQSFPDEETTRKLGEKMHGYLLKDSKVPKAVIEGVGKFINFEKYMGAAVKMGAQEMGKRVNELFDSTSGRA